MKKVLFLLLLLPLLAHAQDGVLSDTSYIENRAGQFWQVRTQVYDSGRTLREEVPYGADTTAVVNALIGSVFPQLTQYATAAAMVQMERARNLQALLAVSGSINQVLGVSYFQAVGGLLESEFLGAYTMRVNGAAPVLCEIVRLPNGALRFRQGGTDFILDVISRNWIRIRRYDGSSKLTAQTNVIVDLFYHGPTRQWVDLTQGVGSIRFRLRKS